MKSEIAVMDLSNKYTIYHLSTRFNLQVQVKKIFNDKF